MLTRVFPPIKHLTTHFRCCLFKTPRNINFLYLFKSLQGGVIKERELKYRASIGLLCQSFVLVYKSLLTRGMDAKWINQSDKRTMIKKDIKEKITEREIKI